jgi:hypothetical protein
MAFLGVEPGSNAVRCGSGVHFNVVPNQFDVVPNQVTGTGIWFYRRIRYVVPYAGNRIPTCRTENYKEMRFR